MCDHMPSILNETKIRARQRLVKISGLFGFDYLVLCSMENTHLTVNVWIQTLELCRRWNQKCAFFRGRAQLFGSER